jgi:hypothetical protein
LEAWYERLESKSTMSENLILSWTISAQSMHGDGGCVANPDWLVVKEKLSKSLNLGGTITLDAEDSNGRSQSLQVRAENGMYVVTFGTESESGWDVRTYKKPAEKSENIAILGEVWDASVVCSELSFIVAIFDEFFSTGGVSLKLLP